MKFDKIINSTNYNYYIIAIIFVFSLFLQVTSFLSFFEISQLRNGSDAATYYYAGLDLLKYHVLVWDRDGNVYNGLLVMTPTYVLSPGFPVIVAIILSIFKESAKAVAASNIIFFMGILIYIYRILKLIKIKVYLTYIILFLVSLYPGFLFNNSKILTEVSFTFFLVSFAYYFIISFNNDKKLYIFLSAICFTLAIHVRGVIIPLTFLILAGYIIKFGWIKGIKRGFLFFATFCLFMLPWWAYTYIVFNRFYLLSAAGENPLIWGTAPYFIGLQNDIQSKLHFCELMINNYNLDSGIFIRWRIFGFIQMMFSYIWDEHLVYPSKFMQCMGVIHYLVIIPTLIIAPFFYKKINNFEKIILGFPYYIVFIYMFFHPLSRYLYPALPFIFIVFAICLNILTNPTIIEKKIKYSFLCRCSDHMFFYLISLLSILITISVLIFPFYMTKDMTAYRMKKNINVNVNTSPKIIANDYFYNEFFPISSNKISYENLTKNDENKFTNNQGNPGIIRVKNIQTLNSTKTIITKIIIASHSKSLLDKMTIYFKNSKGKFNENDVYSIPINCFQYEQIVYAEGDVDELLIVPMVFQYGHFEFRGVTIEKYEL